MPIVEIETDLGKLRRKRGVSAIDLAAAVGVSRQTIYAMEAGTFVPNTAIALRLARVLETTVESLFSLRDDALESLRSQQATLLPDSAALTTGQVVQLCRLDKRLIASAPSAIPWYFPAADGIVAARSGKEGKIRVQVFQRSDFYNRILIAGCDPGISVLSRHLQTAGVELVLAHRNSSQALALLKAGSVHVAGTHLRDESSGESNLPEIGRLFPRNSVAAITFAVWEEGIVTAKGNPKAIRGIQDLSRTDLRIVNREEGSGSRALLDSQLKKKGIPGRRVRGYDALASGHLAAVWQVQTGAVDCCLATHSAARFLGLGFIPLVTERYDLVIRKPHLELPRIQQLLDTLSRSGLRRELDGLGGYDTRVSGERVL